MNARESLLIFGVALLFASTQLAPEFVGVGRYLGILAIGVVSTLTAALSPDQS